MKIKLTKEDLKKMAPEAREHVRNLAKTRKWSTRKERVTRAAKGAALFGAAAVVYKIGQSSQTKES
jgi:hypothetical protein